MTYAKLFVGGFAQYMFATILTRLVVTKSPLGVFGAVFVGQTLWWLNIHQTVRNTSRSHWFAWTTGAACGAATGLFV